jgi:hypothetical protein
MDILLVGAYIYKDAATAKTQFGTKINSTKVMAYLFSFLNMLWHGIYHFYNTGEPIPVHGSTEEMLEFFDISPTEQNQFVFNQSAKYVTIICWTFHPAAIRSIIC